MNEPNATQIARQLAAMRGRSTRPCAVCGQPMPHAYGKRRYCSTACHHKAAYQRMKGRQGTAAEPSAPTMPERADVAERMRELQQRRVLTEQELDELRRLERECNS